MINIYLSDPEQTNQNTIVPGQSFTGTNFYNNCKGKTVLIETWTSSTTSINPTNNFQTYIDISNVQIQNLHKLNGTYVTNYVFNDNYITGVQKELVVYYIGVTNKYRIKVTYLDFFSKVIIKRVK
jgi:hypothetical protein